MVQEVLVQAWQQLDTLREPAAVKAWLLRLTGSRSIDLLRRRRNHASLTGPEDDQPADAVSPGAGPETAVVAGAGITSLKAALSALPEEQRRCWILKEINGQSYDEIARTLNISPASVRGRLARARITLVREMEDWR